MTRASIRLDRRPGVTRDVARVLAQPYARVLVPGEDGYYTATIAELPGVIAEGRTAEEALRRVDEAFAGAVESLLEHGDPVPPPFAAVEYSGRLNLRIPPALHAAAARAAAAQGISLNRFLSDAVARQVGMAATATGSRGSKARTR